MTYPFQWGAATDIGAVRSSNEDVFVAEADLRLFLVLDGMGGHAGGEVAAEAAANDLPALAREHLEAMKGRDPRAVRRWLARLIAEENRRIHLQGLTRSGFEGMGTTMAMILLLADRAYVANLGDSRAYRFRGGRLTQLSKDHSVIRELVDAGEISAAEATYHQTRGLVTQHLGMPDGANPYVRSYALKAADRFLLCSDGLTDQVRDETIREVLNVHTDCQEACDILVDLANAHGGIDNVTVVLVEWTGESREK
jgi:protein phosphatase